MTIVPNVSDASVMSHASITNVLQENNAKLKWNKVNQDKLISELFVAKKRNPVSVPNFQETTNMHLVLTNVTKIPIVWATRNVATMVAHDPVCLVSRI